MPRAVKSLISRCRGSAEVFRFAGFHQTECFHPPGRAGSRASAGAFPARRVSSHHQGLTSSGFMCFFRQLAIRFEHHTERVRQVLAGLFQRVPLRVNPRNFFHPGSPAVAYLLVCSGQLHPANVLASKRFVHAFSKASTENWQCIHGRRQLAREDGFGNERFERGPALAGASDSHEPFLRSWLLTCSPQKPSRR